LRTRTFGEIVALVEGVMGLAESGQGRQGAVVRRGEWLLRSERALHTWPLGYMNAVVGRKMLMSDES